MGMKVKMVLGCEGLRVAFHEAAPPLLGKGTEQQRKYITYVVVDLGSIERHVEAVTPDLVDF